MIDLKTWAEMRTHVLNKIHSTGITYSALLREVCMETGDLTLVLNTLREEKTVVVFHDPDDLRKNGLIGAETRYKRIVP